MRKIWKPILFVLAIVWVVAFGVSLNTQPWWYIPLSITVGAVFTALCLSLYANNKE